MRRGLVLLTLSVVIGLPNPLAAQVFGSIGIAATTDEAADRFPIGYRVPSGHHTLMEAGVFVRGRFGIAAELLQTPDFSAKTTGSFGVFEAAETEHSFTVTVRIRVLHRQRVAFELLGGGGATFVSAETTSRPRSTSIVIARDDAQVPRTIVGGFDAPLRIVPHVYVVGTVRVYHVDRGPMPIVRYDRESGPSTRVLVSGLARVLW